MVAMLVVSTTGASAKKAKEFKKEREVVQPCTGKDFESGKGFIRASATSVDTNMAMAKKRALSAARADIASQMGAVVKRVTDDYVKAVNEESEMRFEERTMTIVKQQIGMTRTICDKVMQTKDKKFRAYVCVEYNLNDAFNGINEGIKSDEELRVDYNYEKFKATFEKEIADFNK